MHKYIGYDLWKSTCSMVDICNELNRANIMIYDLHLKDDGVYFYTLIWQRKNVFSSISCTYVSSFGVLAFFIKKFKSIIFYLQIVIIFMIWYFLINTIFVYEIQGTDGELKKQIINDMQIYSFPIYNMNILDVEQEIFEKHRNQLSWLEVYKGGSKLFIHFSEKKSASRDELKREPLYAMKDAVISSFDIQHGNKLVKVNDFVYKGSVLVDAYMIDSTNEFKELYVKGKVYGYTWYTIDSTINANGNLHDGLVFFRLLLDCRNQISEYISKDESIVQETILHYEQVEGTIVMRVHYTLIEDITIP